MKMQELNNTEIQEVNGGGIFGGSDSSASNSGLLGSVGIGNLLSFQNASRDGDENQASAFSLGNGINLDLGGMFNQVSQDL